MNILIILHVYYLDHWPTLVHYIDNVKQNLYSDNHLSIVVTIPENKDDFKSTILGYDDKITVLYVENRGFDIWPFIKALRSINLQDFDFVIKLHTKRNVGLMIGRFNDTYVTLNLWRYYLLNFINKNNIRIILNAFSQNQKLGMINSSMLFDVTHRDTKDDHLRFCLLEAEKLLHKANLTPIPEDSVTYIAGTMFICRAHLLQPLKDLNLTIEDFIPTNREKIDDLSHILERFFGWSVTSQGYSIEDVFTTKSEHFIYSIVNTLLKILFPIYKICRKIKRFFFRVEIVNDETYYKFLKFIKFKVK